MTPSFNTIARDIVDQNLYMTLGTADAQGTPWVSPVYFAVADYRTFYWVSNPDAQHSRNIADHPVISIVIFDTHAPIGTGQGLYLTATAELVPDHDLEHAIATYSEHALSHGGSTWDVARVSPPAVLRLYRATLTDAWVLDPNSPTGRGDQRVRVILSDTE